MNEEMSKIQFHEIDEEWMRYSTLLNVLSMFRGNDPKTTKMTWQAGWTIFGPSLASQPFIETNDDIPAFSIALTGRQIGLVMLPLYIQSKV